VQLERLEMSFSKHSLLFLAFLSLCLALVSQPDFVRDGIRIRNLQAQAGSLTERDDVPAGYVAAPYYPAPPGGWYVTWKQPFSIPDCFGSSDLIWIVQIV